MLSDFTNQSGEIKREVEQSSGDSQEARLSYFVVGVFVAVLVLTVTIFVFQKVKEAKISSLNNQIKQDVTDQLTNLAQSKKQVATVSDELTALQAAVSNKVKYSILISDITKNQLKNTNWKSFNLQKGSIVLSAVADNFTDVAKSVAELRQISSMKEVKLISSNINEDTKKIEFSVNLVFDELAYKLASKTDSK